MKYNTFFIMVLMYFFMNITNATAKDVSNEIKVSQSGTVIGCITRLEIYAARSKNMFEMPDPNFQRTMVENSLKVSMPYRENIRNAAWGVYPLNQDWDQFYSGQVEIANKNYETNNVFFDTFVCVRDLVAIGVIYPIPKDPSKIPPEQMSIMKKLMQPK